MKNQSILLVFLFTLMLFSCSEDVQEETDPVDNCNTLDMSLQDDILPIFAANCNVCHSSAAASGGITLDNFNGVKATVDAGRLLGAINREPGFSSMPQGGSKLSACNNDKVTSWVDGGALDN